MTWREPNPFDTTRAVMLDPTGRLGHVSPVAPTRLISEFKCINDMDGESFSDKLNKACRDEVGWYVAEPIRFDRGHWYAVLRREV